MHGGSVSSSGLRSNSENGERFLREVWEWHQAQGLTLSAAIARIDQQILADSEAQEKRLGIGLDYPIAGKHFSGSGVSGAGAELGVNGGVLDILMPEAVFGKVDVFARV